MHTVFFWYDVQRIVCRAAGSPLFVPAYYPIAQISIVSEIVVCVCELRRVISFDSDECCFSYLIHLFVFCVHRHILSTTHDAISTLELNLICIL